MSDRPARQDLLASVIVITKDGADAVRTLLESLSSQSISSDSFEVIVVDDGSINSIANDIEATGIKVSFDLRFERRSPGGNRSAARNAGAALARGNIYIFVDSDQVAPSTWIEEHLRWHQPGTDLVLVGHRREYVGLQRETWKPEVRSRVTSVFSDNYSRLSCPWYFSFSANLSVSAQTFRTVGGFDDAFVGWGFEDVEFGYRAHTKGIATAYNPFAWTWDSAHVVRKDAARQHEWQRNRAYFLAKHKEPEAQAITMLDHYPARTNEPMGPAWFRSFSQFEEHVRSITRLQPVWSPEQHVTVLNEEDVVYVKKLLDDDKRIAIHDGNPGSGLDLYVFTTGSQAPYYALRT